MRDRALKEIGLDRPGFLDLIGKERVLDLIAKGWLLELIGVERILDLVGREHVLERIGVEAARQWLQRHEQAAAQEPAPLPPGEPTGEAPN